MLYPFDLFVFMRDGVYIYRPDYNELEFFKEGDYRAVTGNDIYAGWAYMNVCLFGLYEREIIYPGKEEKEFSKYKKKLKVPLLKFSNKVFILCFNSDNNWSLSLLLAYSVKAISISSI